MASRSLAAVAALASILVGPAPALAWGYEGHRVVADLARPYLTPEVRGKVDALLATDNDTLSGHDMTEEATWADSWRGANHPETGDWHFVDTELDSPDVKAACFGEKAIAGPASKGPAEDCVVDKINQFAAELADPQVDQGECLLALKYLLHLVGDVHQPLHASDNHDKGGNCVRLALGAARPTTLHSYWDTGFLAWFGPDPVVIAETLRPDITPAQKRAWESGTPQTWATEAFEIARRTAHSLDFPAGCPADAKPWALPPDYESAVRKAAVVQLKRAGVRLAWVLNRALVTSP